MGAFHVLAYMKRAPRKGLVYKNMEILELKLIMTQVMQEIEVIKNQHLIFSLILEAI